MNDRGTEVVFLGRHDHRMDVIDMRRLIVILAIVLIGVLMAPAALAGGTWLVTVEESYDPGDEVTAVAYVGATATDEPVLARMSMNPMPESGQLPDSAWLELGAMTLEPTGLSGYLETRVSITFTLPEDLEKGVYYVSALRESGGRFGDLDGMALLVDVQPPDESRERWFELALDDPLIAELPDDAMISGPGFAVSVAALRAGRYPLNAEAFMLHPENLPDPPPRLRAPSVADQPPVGSVSGDQVVDTPPDEPPIEPASPPVVQGPESEELGPTGPIGAFAFIIGGIVFAATFFIASRSGERRDDPDRDSPEAQRIRIRA